jgi:hypothetical protein
MLDDGRPEPTDATTTSDPAGLRAKVPGGGEHHCPWCSVTLGSSVPDRCPSCGAVLVEDPDTSVPGLTAVDPDAVKRAATWERTRQRSSIRDLFEVDRGEAEESGVQPSSIEALDPPSMAIRVEMARIKAELEAAAEHDAAELAALQAEAEAEPPTDDLDASDSSETAGPKTTNG